MAKTASTLAVGYLRRSTDRQEQPIPDQKAAMQRYADDHGFSIAQFYTDDAISGTSTVGRHAFQSMIADVRRTGRRIRFVIVYDVKRFGCIDNDEACASRDRRASAWEASLPRPFENPEVSYCDQVGSVSPASQSVARRRGLSHTKAVF